MSGNVTVDLRSTFAAMILMGIGEKMQFGTAIPETTRDGERKYTAEVAVTYHAEGVMKPVSEVISVTITGGDHGAILGIPVGSLVSVDRLRCGVSAPEKREDGRVRGGKLYWMASGIRPAQAQAQKAA